jgi:NitT/TauT family transport system ATP-binding protein
VSEPYITVRDVSKRYLNSRDEPVHALAPIDLDVYPGEFVCLIGPSGCGKSTLLSIIGGLTKPDTGQVSLAGESVTGPAANTVAFVFQDYTLLPWRTVERNVELGLQLRKTPRDQRKDIVARSIAVVGLTDYAKAYPAELSGGMQQRVAVARALAVEPSVLLMDEPFGALDEQTRMVLGDDLSEIVSTAGQITLFVTHSLSEAVYLADRVVVMSARPGRVKEIITVDEPRPRSTSFRTSDHYNDVHRQLFDSLRDEIFAGHTS